MLAAILGSVVILAISSEARSDELLRVVVLPSVIKSDHAASLLTAEALHDEVFRALDWCLDLDVLSRAETETGLIAAIAGCGSNGECATSRLESAQVWFGVEVILNAQIDPPILTVRVLDARKRSVVQSYVEELDASGPSLSNVLALVLDRLVRDRGWRVEGRLRVDVAPADAEVSIEPAPPHPAENGVYRVPAGVYRVRASRDGSKDAETTAVVGAREEADVKLALEEESIASSPWLWVAIVGAVVAAGAITAAIALRPHDLEICQSSDPKDCP